MVVDRIATYREVSPSGSGVKMLLEGVKPAWQPEQAEPNVAGTEEKRQADNPEVA